MVLIVCSVGAWSTAFSQDFDPQHLAELRHHIEQKLDRFLIRDKALNKLFAIQTDGFAMYGSPADKEADRPEIFLYWDEIEAFQRLVYGLDREATLSEYLAKGRKRFRRALLRRLPALPRPFVPNNDPVLPLLGLRVALDPGHLGGEMSLAVLERRAVQMHPDAAAGFPDGIAFNEGNLTLATAMILKGKLESAGAEVLMTREWPGHSAFGSTFDSWLESDFEQALERFAHEHQLTREEAQWWLNEATCEEIFHGIFKNEELRERARKINAWKPHLTLILHYNAEESNWPPGREYSRPVKENFNLAFIPGSYLHGELATPDRRFDFLAQLFTVDIERSLALSTAVVAALQRRTAVPPLDCKMGQSYLERGSMRTGVPGVWARNLALNRLIRGPSCYAESLFQDNEKECMALNRRDLEVAGIVTSSRILDVAQAYFEAILEFAAATPAGGAGE